MEPESEVTFGTAPDPAPAAIATEVPEASADPPDPVRSDAVEPKETNAAESTAQATSTPRDEEVLEPATPRKPPLPVYGFGAYLGEDFDAFAHAQRTSGS